MPPRRSSRTRASVEPPSQPPKRKRSSPDENKAPSIQEDVKPVLKSRVSRSTKTLEDVEEDKEEDAEDSPPVKKARPSLERESVAEEDGEDEDEQPVRARRSASRRVPPRVQRGKATVKAEEDEEEDELQLRSPARRNSKKKAVESSEDEYESDKPPPKARNGSVAASRGRRGRGRGRSSVPPRASSSRARRSTASVEPESERPAPAVESDDSDTLSYAEPELNVPVRGPTTVQPIAEETEEEDERSLLEPEVARSPTPKPATAPAVAEPLGPKARLVIHKMVLINFKSYAGRQEIGPFHKSFSSIVGPNGSGKSNTIDALLFVFGYRASKMRQAKLSELIHTSARYPDLDDCAVEVHFREIYDLPGPDAFEIVPDSQLVVTRTAYKNNSSRYTINGQVRTYKEVQTLLKGRGIDLDHNRFLILQGEVESIAQMKPKAPNEHEDGLLEYLEDIIGTAEYKKPIEEASQILDTLNEERTEKMNRLKIVEREKDALEKDKKEAEDYLRLHNEHVRALSRLWQWYVWKCLLNEEDYAAKISDVEKELKEETEQNKDDVTHLKMLEKHYQERCDAYEDIKNAAAAALKEQTATEKKQVSLEERRKHAKGKAKKLEKTLKDDERAKADAERAIEDNSEKIEKEKKKVDDYEISLAKEETTLEEIRDSLKDRTQVYHDQIEGLQRDLQPWTAKINAKQAELNVAQGERDDLVEKAEAAKTALDEAQAAFDQLQEDQRAKNKELEELTSQKTSKAQELRDEQRRLQNIRASVQELRTKASSSRQKVDEAKSSQAANTSQNKVLDALNKLRSTGRLEGFHGRLGSLGTIPDKYDVAVSTACGALHNLVVDTVEQGQACIEHLRKQNIGRASFMVLNKLPPSRMERPQTPENVPRLFDLIKPKDARFAAAFYKAAGETLVADTLDQANRIAFGGAKRWRVVTLAGQLIESSGAMSGGGTQVMRGGMSSKLQQDSVSPETLRQYAKDSEAAQRQLEEALGQVEELEATIDMLSKAGPQIDISIQKVNLDIRTIATRIADAGKRLRELRDKTKPDSADIARISTLDKHIAKFTSELEKLKGKTVTINEQMGALEKKILEIGGARLLAQKSKVEGIRLHMNLAHEEITKAEVAKSKAEKDVKKLEGVIAANTKALKEVLADLEVLETELEECNQYLRDITSKVADAQTAVENSKDDLKDRKAELDEKTEQIQIFRAKEMELQQQLTELKREAASNEASMQHWQGEHDKLRLADIDDDEDDDEDDEDDNGPDPDGGNADADAHGAEGEDEDHERARSSRTLRVYTAEELSHFKKREMMADAELLDEKVKNAKPNPSVLKDYKRRKAEFEARASDLRAVNEKREQEKKNYENLCKRRLDEFMAGFNTISLKLKEMYQMITLGGNAELELVDSMDPFSEGIIFSVMPPKKSWKNISNLSGGEKTLSSLALVFALHVYKPTPLYFMDEIDAALDFRNVSIVANYIKDRTKDAQFIIISLRNDMFELSHRLIGIYKTSNATRSIAIDNHSLHAVPSPTAGVSSRPPASHASHASQVL